MKDLFVPYEVALALKEIGFDEPCFGYYDAYNGTSHLVIDTKKASSGQDYIDYICDGSKTGVLAPTYDQVTDWFIEKYDYYIKVWINYSFPAWWDASITCEDEEDGAGTDEFGAYDTRKEALNAGILKAIELVKQKT